jgi:hypothetical protein
LGGTAHIPIAITIAVDITDNGETACFADIREWSCTIPIIPIAFGIIYIFTTVFITIKIIGLTTTPVGIA